MTTWEWKVIMALVRVVYHLVRHPEFYPMESDIATLAEAISRQEIHMRLETGNE